MDTICQELGIPRKQIKETQTANRFLICAHKGWLKCLSQKKKLLEFPIYLGTDEWPEHGKYADTVWTNVYLSIYKKYNHTVIPLPHVRDSDSSNEAPMYFSQLLQYISQSNHQSFWKTNYKKYSNRKAKPISNGSNHLKKSTERNSMNLQPYDSVLREIIHRMYGCSIIHAQLDKIKMNDNTEDVNKTMEFHHNPEMHVNLYPVIAAIETSSHFVLVFAGYIQNSLMDCVTYSPAILSKSHNKPLFLLYQLLQLSRCIHEHGLLLGNVRLSDVYLTENLWLQVIPQLDVNILNLDSIEEDDSNAGSGKGVKKLNYTIRDTNFGCSLKDYCEMWCHGQLSNFDYLTILNNLSGRRLGMPGHHHIMPWVTDFTARNGANWRDLKKSKYRLNKGDALLDLMFTPSSENHVPHHVSDVLSEITYYVYMARRTSKNLLCKHVRPIWVPGEYPVSIQRLQEWTPDECIPEFFSDPLVFKSIHEDLPDLEVPTWTSCPEDFVTKHREALESQHVSERLHHWIDLNFGYKLTGPAAVKAKNVCLSLVNDHENLCERGIVQLFTYPHPPKQCQTLWTSKNPPRHHSHFESQKRRLTRSTEDLTFNPSIDYDSSQLTGDEQSSSSSPSRNIGNSPNYRNRSPIHHQHQHQHHQELDNIGNIERSTSLHANVQKSQNQIILPKDFNPIGTLTAVENIEIFLSRTFYSSSKLPHKELPPRKGINLNAVKPSNSEFTEENGNSFTNRIFAESYETGLVKDTKRFHNLTYKNQIVQNSTRNYKNIMAENRNRELQVIGCLIVEIFLAQQLRPLGSCLSQTFAERFDACTNVLNYDFDCLPKCIQYPIKLMLLTADEKSSSVLNEKGLPQPNPHQFLQPLLSNLLFPFPLSYTLAYKLLQSFMQFELVVYFLKLNTFFDCDGRSCKLYEQFDRSRAYFSQKIAECKVKSFVIQSENVLQPIGYEQFNHIELILPYIIDMLKRPETAISVAWYLFDSISIALGPKLTQEHLLEPILYLYDTGDVDDQHNSTNSSVKYHPHSLYKSRKAIRLYHHSFLMKLIVRFGLKRFLKHFISPLIEAVGGYKETQDHLSYYHYHNNSGDPIKKSRSTKNFNCNKNDSRTSPVEGETSERSVGTERICVDEDRLTMGKEAADEMFKFEDDNGLQAIGSGTIPNSADDMSDNDTETAIMKIIDNFDLTSAGSLLDLHLNHSMAEEAIETMSTTIPTNPSTDQSTIQSSDATKDNPMSPTIPIPSLHRELNTIDCEIGSKKSIDSNEFLQQQLPHSSSDKKDESNVNVESVNVESCKSVKNFEVSSGQTRIAEMSAESLIWLSHRLGPVLTAKHITRNLLKMLTLCYVGQENLLPAYSESVKIDNLIYFSISNGRVIGDLNALRVLQCLTTISALFGDHFIHLQYFPHISELIMMCKRRITASLEGGLISSLQLLKFLVPCLSDAIIMDQLHEVILKNIIHPIIRLLASSRFLMPNGFLSRSVLARKLLDVLYVLAVRIGPEMTKEHLCVPTLQRFFLIFDKAYGISDHFKNDEIDGSPTNSSDDSNYIDIRREGSFREWEMGKGSPTQNRHIKRRSGFDSSTDTISPPPLQSVSTSNETANDYLTLALIDRARDEIRDVFTPQLAHVAYLSFLKYLGEQVMSQIVKNFSLILSLCHEYEQPTTHFQKQKSGGNNESNRSCMNVISLRDSDVPIGSNVLSNSFGSAVIGNRLDIPQEEQNIEMGAMELLDIVAYKHDIINTSRHLRGNWLAYWEHEIGRSEKDTHFNLKQIKLQTYAGHSNSVRSLLCLDNENSFMSASKDKTVKLWSLRSEGDGSKVSFCQFSYTNHRKSVHSLAFLESLRLTISCDSGIHLWDPFVGAQVGQLDSHKLTPVSVVKTYPAPSPLVLAGTAESTLKIIDGRTFAYVNEWKVSPTSSGSVRCIAVSPSGAWIAVGLSSGQLTLFDGRTGIIIASWKATDGELLQLNAPNERQIVSSSLDHNICVWSSIDGSLLFHMKNPAEPAHCILSNGRELLFGTPANRIGIYSSVGPDIPYSITKLRSETFRGVLTSLALLPLNRMLLIGGDSGNISLLC